jgi:Tetratricopeptide repeat
VGGQHGGVPASPALAASWQQAEALQARGDLPAARDILEPAVEVAAMAYGADHPDVIETQLRLALVHRDMDDWAAARRVLEEALAGGLVRFGEADPLMLALSAELGAAAEQLGNRHEARRNFTRIIRYGPQVLGVNHPYVRAAQVYLGGESVGPVYIPPPRAEPVAAEAPLVAPESTTVPEHPSAHDRGALAPPEQATAQQEQATAQQEQATAQQEQATATPPDMPPGVPTPRDVPRPAEPAPPAPPQMAIPAPPDLPAPPEISWVDVPPPVPPPSVAPPSQRPVLVPEPEPGVWRPEPARPVPEPGTCPVPEPPVPTPVPAPPVPTRRPTGARHAEERHRVRTPLIVLTAVALTALAAASVLAVLAFLAPPASRSTTPATAGSPSVPVLTPPGDVSLLDNGASITLTWTDPGRGTLPFIVSGGRAGEQSHPYPPLPPGQTTFTVNGLNASVDYCFTVLAVYTTDEFAPSDLVCTRRTGTPVPSASR